MRRRLIFLGIISILLIAAMIMITDPRKMGEVLSDTDFSVILFVIVLYLLNGLVKVFGYAAKPISDALQKKGGSPAADPEGFIVLDTEGPMKEGEVERASEWARALIG